VRHTRAASHNLRTMNKTIADNYDSGPVTASSDVALRNGDIEICLRFLHMPATCSPICPSLQQRPPRSTCTRERIDHERRRSSPASSRFMNTLSKAKTPPGIGRRFDFRKCRGR
jgi:hypothetical protein